MSTKAGILRLKIDVTKLDKSAFFKGNKGTYADITVLLKDEPDQYGNDGMIVQDVGKERREAGEKGPILGNAKWAGQKQPQRQASPKAANDKGWDKFDEEADEDGTDLPF